MKTVLVTGGSRGIGKACALAFGKVGWRVALCSRTPAEQTKNQLIEMGIDAEAFAADVSDSEAVRAMFEQLDRFSARLDCLITAAGIAESKLFSDITYEDWRRIMAVNADGTFNCVSEAVKRMLKRRQGSIITVSSVWGQTGGACETHYSASKAAVIGLSRALAKELAPSGIRVNCLCPGVIDTDMFRSYSETDRAIIEESIPLGRAGTARECAEAALFLAENEYMTGQILPINGGMYI